MKLGATIRCCGVLLLAGFASEALAADLPVRPYTKAPAPPAVQNWTGFYVGLNGGYGWGRTIMFAAPGGLQIGYSLSGGLVGGQAGYNWQVGALVFGIEADGDWANLRSAGACQGPAFNCASDTRALASLRGRLGGVLGSALLYVTGGLGYANTHYSALTFAAGLPFAGTTGIYDTTRWGYTAGVGIEYGFARNWSAKVEYLHYGFDRVDAPVGTLAPAVAVATTLRIDTVKVGLNYRWGGPIVAKY